MQYSDDDLLQFILGLEHFSDAFYRSALQNWTQEAFAQDGFNADFYTNLTDLSKEESTHVSSLTKTLQSHNVTPVAECVYNFNGTRPLVFVQDATLIEGVSVSAYLGILPMLRSKQFLNVYSSVLAVEARHSAFVRAALGESPFPSPFDTPLDLDEVHTLVELFVVSCPEGSDNPLNLKVLQPSCKCFALIDMDRIELPHRVFFLQQPWSDWYRDPIRHIRPRYQSHL